MHPSPNEALVALLHALEQAGYRFTAVTPATHARIMKRREGQAARDLRDVFGWNLPFPAEILAPELLERLRNAEVVHDVDGLMKSRLRAASLGGRLFLHSAYPTVKENSVFFGPDTYRFAALIEAELRDLNSVRRIVDIGAGSGAGGIVAAGLAKGAQVTLSDVNPAALRLAAINARHAGLEAELVEGADLDGVAGPIDLIVANPPYVMDECERAYRDGGGMHGAALSLEWALAGARRLEPGGRMLLYTGVAILTGRDPLREALERELPPLGCTLRYREIDPDIFGEELEKPAYHDVERIAAVGAVITRR